MVETLTVLPMSELLMHFMSTVQSLRKNCDIDELLISK